MNSPDKEAGTGWEDLKGEAAPRERSWAPRLIVAGLALLAATIFIAQNNEPTETQFLFFKGEPRLFNVIIVSMLLGAGLAQIAPLLWRRRKSRRAKPTAQPD